MMWDWNDGAWGWGSWAAMVGSMLLVTLIVVGVVVWAVTWASRSSTTTHRSFETPRAVLDRRLAAGEITEDEYAKARRLIEDHSTTPTG